ncbi:uncharacterized protein LOC123502882 [Portunus trituberculatus]|uniref:uncharacterized protein LOC123502882 n=1 Tax=Portunus trituberculatus TaxID=210409 RepID=UPI001E1CE8D6|nr:uncharacterized protein LOC123502882 [Portunus trituberculatus]
MGGLGGRGVAMRVVVMVMAAVVLLSITILSRPYSDHLLLSLEGPLPTDHPELLRYLRQEVLVPPATGDYNLLGRKNAALLKMEKSEVFYNETLRTLLADKRGGFFVEAGALDGESMSNTLWLEQERGWTGLLVEADRTAFLALRDKRRKAWAANVCLAPTPFPAKMLFTQSSHAPGPLSKPLGFKMRAMNGLVQYSTKQVVGDSWFQRVQCVALESLLMSLGVQRVDLLVLDVEGAEQAVLNHLDLDKFNVQVLCLEWKKQAEQQVVVDDLAQRGFELVARLREDLVLVRRGSEYATRLPTTTLPKASETVTPRTVHTAGGST